MTTICDIGFSVKKSHTTQHLGEADVSIYDIWDFIVHTDCEGGIMIVILGCILSLIEISPIKINPWTALCRLLAKAVGITDLSEDVKTMHHNMDELDAKLDSLKREEESARDLREALNSRRRILRFNDELLQGMRHSKEMFDDVLVEDIKKYDDYCRNNPDFINQKCVFAKDNIENAYQKCMVQHDFL